jgi:hypothetical protein
MYDKPKVFIDLEEYNELKQKISEYNADDQINMAKEVTLAVLQSRGNPEEVRRYLATRGIEFATSFNPTTEKPMGEIHFRRIEKKKQ